MKVQVTKTIAVEYLPKELAGLLGLPKEFLKGNLEIEETWNDKKIYLGSGTKARLVFTVKMDEEVKSDS